MRVLIGNTVKTDTSDYSFGTREEAEAFYMTLKVERGPERKASKLPKSQARTVRAKPSVRA